MFVLFLILIILTIVLFVMGLRQDKYIEVCWWLAIVTLIGSIFMAALGLHIKTGESYYTGYIYQVSNKWNKAIGYIRLSQEAGTDSQPEFCVDKKDAEVLTQYVGKNIKVKVTEPAGFMFTVTECPFPVTVEVMEEE